MQKRGETNNEIPNQTSRKTDQKRLCPNLFLTLIDPSLVTGPGTAHSWDQSRALSTYTRTLHTSIQLTNIYLTTSIQLTNKE